MIVHTHVLFIDELNGIESTYIIDKYTTDSPDVVQGALSIMTLVYPAGNKPTTFTGPNELLHVTCTLTSLMENRNLIFSRIQTHLQLLVADLECSC